MRTVILKLYKPGKAKREILDYAISNYNQAYRYLLESAYADIASIREKYAGLRGIYKASALSKWPGREICGRLNQFHAQPFKDSLKLDLGMTLAGYLRLGRSDPGTKFPLTTKSCPAEKHPPEFKEARRPVYFCRYDTKRSYCLLYNQSTDRYYAKLYLMDYANARPADAGRQRSGMLTYLHKDKKALETGGRKETFLLMPLSFGKYQEKFLRRAKENPGIIRTAKLYSKGNNYFLAVSMDTEETDKVNPETFLGAARGIESKLYYTVINREGSVLDSGPISDKSIYRTDTLISSDELHRLANRIVSIAARNKSQVILQNLTQKGDRINWTEGGKNYRPALNCRDYNRLVKILEYKLPEKGLPLPVKVSSTDIFYRCPVCGCHSKGNRFTKEVFLCLKCGSTMETDRLGSFNLAEKLLVYRQSKIKIKVTETPGGIRFFNRLIGLDLFLSGEEDHLERLREEIRRLACALKQRAEAGSGQTGKLRGIIKKIDYSEDILEAFELE